MARLSNTERIARSLLKWYLPDLTYHYNIRPTQKPGAKTWQITQSKKYGIDLEGLELDIYVPEWKLAVEVMGSQHYRQIEHFTKGDTQVYLDQIERDSRKVELCQQQGVTLYHATIFDLLQPKFEPFIKRLMKDHGLLEQFRRTTPPRSLYIQAERLSRAKVSKASPVVTPSLLARLWGRIRPVR